MARKEQVEFVDDYDGTTDVEGGQVKLVQFGLDDTNYEAHMGPKSREGLDAVLGEYVRHARKVSPARPAHATRGRNRSTATSATSGIPTTEKSLEIRNWARQNGHPNMKDRGRIPAIALADYNRVHGTNFSN